MLGSSSAIRPAATVLNLCSYYLGSISNCSFLTSTDSLFTANSSLTEIAFSSLTLCFASYLITRGTDVLPRPSEFLWACTYCTARANLTFLYFRCKKFSNLSSLYLYSVWAWFALSPKPGRIWVWQIRPKLDWTLLLAEIREERVYLVRLLFDLLGEGEQSWRSSMLSRPPSSLPVFSRADSICSKDWKFYDF